MDKSNIGYELPDWYKKQYSLDIVKASGYKVYLVLDKHFGQKNKQPKKVNAYAK